MVRELDSPQPECPECHSRLYSVPVFKTVGTPIEPSFTNSTNSTDMLICYHCLQNIARKPQVESLFELEKSETVSLNQ